jgi:hypothetical protein
MNWGHFIGSPRPLRSAIPVVVVVVVVVVGGVLYYASHHCDVVHQTPELPYTPGDSVENHICIF